MNKKNLVGIVVAVLLGVAAYLWGPDMVALVKEQVGVSDVAPIQSDTEVKAPETPSGE